jgi:excisionase family DNA binding protein
MLPGSIRHQTTEFKAMNHGSARIAFSVDEAAQQANVCRDKIYQAIRTGELDAKKAGRRTLVMADDLRRYLESLPRLTLPAAK